MYKCFFEYNKVYVKKNIGGTVPYLKLENIHLK